MKYKSAEEIASRFIEELESIENYMQFLNYKTSALNTDLREVSQLLKKYGFFKSNSNIDNELLLGTRENRRTTLFNKIRKTEPQIKEKLNNVNNSFKELEYPEKLNTIDVRTEFGEIILSIRDELKEDTTIDLEKYKIEKIRKLKPIENDLRLDLFYIDSIQGIESAVEYSIKSARYLLIEEELEELQFIIDAIDQIDIMMKMSGTDNQLGILRQGFILLMTVFDATIFDLMRIALDINFFELIGILSKNDKITLDSFKDYENFENFKETIFESQLQKKYVKDILIILKNVGVKIASNSSGDQFANLIEIINRRNIHIHNLGIVDSKYLERRKSEVTAFNIFNFALGDYAAIDHKYLNEANLLCKNCITGIKQWIIEENARLLSTT